MEDKPLPDLYAQCLKTAISEPCGLIKAYRDTKVLAKWRISHT